MFIIVGLGNKGLEYNNTYHNIGFMVADKLSEKMGLNFEKEKFKSVIAEGMFKGQKVLIAKPTTYMNRSGEALVLLKNKFRDAKILVAVDDIDLPRGKVRYRERGSAGTHNGLRSIVEFIGEEFERVKVGVDRDKNKDLADYVVSKIDKNSKEVIDKAIDDACEIIIQRILKEGKC